MGASIEITLQNLWMKQLEAALMKDVTEMFMAEKMLTEYVSSAKNIVMYGHQHVQQPQIEGADTKYIAPELKTYAKSRCIEVTCMFNFFKRRGK